MQLPTKLHALYQSFFKDKQLFTIATELKMDIRTLKKVIETGQTTDKVMKKINKYITKTNRELKKLTDDNN